MQSQNFQQSQDQPPSSSQIPSTPPPPYPGTTYVTSSAGMPYYTAPTPGSYPTQHYAYNVPGQYEYGHTVIVREREPRSNFLDQCFLLACCYALLCCCCSPFNDPC